MIKIFFFSVLEKNLPVSWYELDTYFSSDYVTYKSHFCTTNILKSVCFLPIDGGTLQIKSKSSSLNLNTGEKKNKNKWINKNHFWYFLREGKIEITGNKSYQEISYENYENYHRKTLISIVCIDLPIWDS